MNLQELRKKNKLTQKELADKLGVKPNTVSNWENGKSTISWEKKELIAELFDILPNEIETPADNRTTYFMKRPEILQLEKHYDYFIEDREIASLSRIVKNIADCVQDLIYLKELPYEFEQPKNEVDIGDILFSLGTVQKSIQEFTEQCHESIIQHNSFQIAKLNGSVENISVAISEFVHNTLSMMLHLFEYERNSRIEGNDNEKIISAMEKRVHELYSISELYILNKKE